MNTQAMKFGFRLSGRLAGIGLLLTFLLGACGSAPTPLPTEDVRPVINTAVAASVAARVTKVDTPTATPSPTVTFTPAPTSTRSPVTRSPVTPTSTSIWWRDYSPYSTCADSAFIKDVTIPDGTVLLPGETFVKTWRFRNTGSCTWTTNYSLAFVKGSDMGGSDDTLGQSVRVNKNMDVSLALTAPSKEGAYSGYWRLQDDYGYFFGDLVYVQIVVSDGIITITTTPVNTPIFGPTLVPPEP